MNSILSQIAPYFWLVVAILAAIVLFVVIRFFWHHILKFVLQGCLAIVGILALLAVLHYFFKLF
jgi:hypothetical protein